MREYLSRRGSDRRLWRSRWAAIGAAVAVTFGAGGLVAVNAAGGVESTTVLADPARVLDSRDSIDVGLAGPFASQVSQKLKITGSIPTTTGTSTVVPAGATGVLLNVTSVGSTADGFISIRPGDATGVPSTSSLNFDAGSVVPNAVLVALPTSGPNAGQIDITYDAYGASGPITDVLIDVVGYTRTAELGAVMDQLDALTAANAAQQSQIDAKANSADVYTKAEIDASAASSVRAAGYVSSTGTQDCIFWACIGTWSSTRTSVGQYAVSIPEASILCRQPLMQLTAAGVGFSANYAGSALVCGVGGTYTLTVRTYNPAGALADQAFFFSLQVEPTNLTTPALEMPPPYEVCVADETGDVSCQ
jgi:hypothetical protein